MILPRDLIKKAAAGKKTQLRRPVDAGEEAPPYRKGRSYGLQHDHRRRAATRVEVTGVRKELLHAITEDEAAREGFKSTEVFLAAWEREYGNRDDITVWVIDFVVTDEGSLYLAMPVAGRRGDYTRIRDHAIDDLPVVAPEDLVDDSDLRYMLLSRYVGWEPEDVLADAPQFNTTDDIKRLRRDLEQRGVDGLPRPSREQLERTLDYMVTEGRSVRDVARAMDCSVGQAHKLIRERSRREAA